MATDMLLEPMGGVFLAPGVSKNRRLYTREMIAKAVARMQARIADPDGLPIVMRTHHDAKDNSRLIVGRVTEVDQDEQGRGRFKFQWYNTAPARDIAALVRPADGSPPALRSVSIHGWFIDPRQEKVDGESIMSASDLEIDAVDFTATPGVTGALIDLPDEPTESAPARPGCVAIFETWEDPMPETTTGQVEPVADEAYTAAQKRDALDKGQAMKNVDGEPSYPIKSKADLRRAIRAVGRGGADHDKIRAHIVDRAAALGLSKMIPDNWNKDGSLKESAGTRFGEIRECYDAMAPAGAGFAIDAYNGPVSLTLRAPNLDPSSLRAVASAAMGAAMDALGALDPDFDADIDVPGAPAEDTDGDMREDADPQDPEAATPDDDETEDCAPGSGCPCGCGCAVPDEMVGGSGCPCACGCEVCGASGSESTRSTAPTADGATVTEQLADHPESIDQPGGHVEPVAVPDPVPQPNPVKESAVSETTTAAEAATPSTPAAPTQAPVIQLSQEQFTQLLAAVRPPVAEAAPAPAVEQPVAPTPEPLAAVEQAPAAETVNKTDLAETVATAVNSALAQAIPAIRDSIVSQYGLPPRTGIRTTETDSGEKELSPTQLWDNRAELLLGPVGR